MKPLKVALAMSDDVAERIFPPARLAGLGPELELISATPLSTFAAPHAAAVLAETDVLITGWGCPPLTTEVLDMAPKLRFALHAAGSVKEHVTDEVWRRGITVSTAAEANAIPVAEYTLAMILLANKKVLQLQTALKTGRGRVDFDTLFPGLGNYGQTVGIIGASKVGRALIGMLRPFAFTVLVADPYLSGEEAANLGVTAVDLDQLLAASDVVSVHAPNLPQTHHLIDERALALIRPGATFINTSRGALVDQDALVRRLQRGDLFAILDVTTPDRLAADHPLYELPNVILTPHVAGSLGVELERLGATALDEARRAARGEPLLYRLDPSALAWTA
jgi:phosphoglycerate dehydrogenase-like enzyme